MAKDSPRRVGDGAEGDLVREAPLVQGKGAFTALMAGDGHVTQQRRVSVAARSGVERGRTAGRRAVETGLSRSFRARLRPVSGSRA